MEQTTATVACGIAHADLHLNLLFQPRWISTSTPCSGKVRGPVHHSTSSSGGMSNAAARATKVKLGE